MAYAIIDRLGALSTRCGAALLVVVLGLGAPLVASAQQSPGPKVGVIDLQRILRESLAVKKLSEEVESLRAGYQSDLDVAESEFRAADLQLARDRPNLSPEEFAERRRELEVRAATLQRDFQDRKKELDQLFGRGMAQIQQALLKISQEIAVERELDLLFAKATVVLVKPNLEITGEALARLNAEISAVDLPVPQN